MSDFDLLQTVMVQFLCLSLSAPPHRSSEVVRVCIYDMWFISNFERQSISVQLGQVGYLSMMLGVSFEQCVLRCVFLSIAGGFECTLQLSKSIVTCMFLHAEQRRS